MRLLNKFKKATCNKKYYQKTNSRQRNLNVRLKMKVKEIKKWLIDNDMSQKEIAIKAGVSHTAVHNVIRGKMTSKRIVKLFLDLGCPKEYLEKAA